MDDTPDLEQRVAAIATFDLPVRRQLFRFLTDAERPISRDDAAEALDIPRSVAAFHLDKLADVGLVVVHFERTTGRSGPGAGRPTKLYSAADREVAVSVPDRSYDLAGALFAAGIDESKRTGAPIAKCLTQAARAAGRALGEESSAAAATSKRSSRAQRRRSIVEVLRRHGYEPRVARNGAIALKNCPFHRLAEQHRDLVCGMNLDFLAGLLEGFGPGDGLGARLAPEPGYCCVRITS
jgi:predicted ArsR family transcriptional regulator